MPTLDSEHVVELREVYFAARCAETVYAQLIAHLGPVQPLPTLRDSAARDADVLEALFQRWGLRLPEPRARGPCRRFTTIPQAIAAAVAAARRDGDRARTDAEPFVSIERVFDVEHVAAHATGEAREAQERA